MLWQMIKIFNIKKELKIIKIILQLRGKINKSQNKAEIRDMKETDEPAEV